jgi:predicted metalloprotease
MRWDRGYSNPEVEDRRGEGPTYGGGGGGGGGFALIRLFSMFGWKGMIVGVVLAAGLALCQLRGGGGGPGVTSSRPTATSPAEDELARFVGYVFEDVQKSWRSRVPGYEDTRIVLFRGSTRSGCGTAQAAVGPFYCPNDRKVYIDLGFYDMLRQRFGAPGDFAQAYVIAHEIGHHVQDTLGLLGHGRGDSVKTELQADCLAGVWAKDAETRGELENGDLSEALNAASQIGDDTLQKREQGYVQPETFTHGTSAQRQASFRAGYDGGPRACGVELK